MISPEARETIIKLHKAGYSVASIANNLGYRRKEGMTKADVFAAVESVIASIYRAL